MQNNQLLTKSHLELEENSNRPQMIESTGDMQKTEWSMTERTSTNDARNLQMQQ
jgi:hypothetical protein